MSPISRVTGSILGIGRPEIVVAIIAKEGTAALARRLEIGGAPGSRFRSHPADRPRIQMP